MKAKPTGKPGAAERNYLISIRVPLSVEAQGALDDPMLSITIYKNRQVNLGSMML